jgi:hypothetical protein
MARDRGSILLNAALVVVFASFAYANLMSWRQTGRPVGLGAVALEAMTAVLFLIRDRPRQTSSRPVAWASAFGSFALALSRPIADPSPGPLWIFELLQVAGFVIAISALVFLGRSFGVVAALRRVKTCGLYRWVRHPVYAGYLAAYSASGWRPRSCAFARRSGCSSPTRRTGPTGFGFGTGSSRSFTRRSGYPFQGLSSHAFPREFTTNGRNRADQRGEACGAYGL